MITQEDVPLLSILDILLAHVNICCDGIHRWIVAIGSVQFGLSFSIGKVCKEIGIHFAAQLLGFTGDLFPIGMCLVCGLPHRLAHFHFGRDVVNFRASLHQLIRNEEISILYVHRLTALHKLRPSDGQGLGHSQTNRPFPGRICRHCGNFVENLMCLLLVVSGREQRDQTEEKD
jgi:hypothetical protein